MSSQAGFPLLTLITFFPLLGAAVLLFVDREKKEMIRWITLLVALLEFLFSLPLFFNFRLDTGAMQFVEKVPWIPDYGITYYLGIDGISLFLVLLTTLLTFVSVMACWRCSICLPRSTLASASRMASAPILATKASGP